MNKNELINTLNSVLTEDTDLAVEKARSLPAEIAEILFYSELSEPVRQVLTRQSLHPSDKYLMINIGNGQTNFDCQRIAAKLVKIAQRDTAEAAVNWLEKVLNTTEAQIIFVMALWGIKYGESIDLTNNIKLMPITDLPPSLQKNDLLNSQESIGFVGSTAASMFSEPPAVALVAKEKIKPFFSEFSQDKDFMPPPLQKSISKLPQALEEIRLCLTLVGPCTPIQALHWFQFEDEELEAAKMSTGRGYKHIEIVPVFIEYYGHFDPMLAQQLISNYLKLEGKVKDKVNIALERLNQAMRRMKDGDRAMELAIALETLLTEGGGEHTWKVGLRAALLVGGSREMKLHNRAVIGGIYALRSSLVHDGNVGNTVKLKIEGTKQTRDVVREGILICAAVIRKVIEKRRLPDWYLFELGEEEDFINA